MRIEITRRGANTTTPKASTTRVVAQAVQQATHPDGPRRAWPFILAISTAKGGVGKTAISSSVGRGLARLGHRTLIIDFEGQGGQAIRFGLKPPQEEAAEPSEMSNSVNDYGEGLLESLMEPYYSEDGSGPALHPVDVEPNLAVVPGGGYVDAFVGYHTTLQHPDDYALARALHAIAGDWDIIIVDTAPSNPFLQRQTLAAAHGLLMPTDDDPECLEGVSRMINSAQEIRDEGINDTLMVLGAIIETATVAWAMDDPTKVPEIRRQVTERLPEGTHILTTVWQREPAIQLANKRNQSPYDFLDDAEQQPGWLRRRREGVDKLPTGSARRATEMIEALASEIVAAFQQFETPQARDIPLPVGEPPEAAPTRPATPHLQVQDSIQHYSDLPLSDPHQFHGDILRLIGSSPAPTTRHSEQQPDAPADDESPAIDLTDAPTEEPKGASGAQGAKDNSPSLETTVEDGAK